jgi:type I restriction enzyme, S subunit
MSELPEGWCVTRLADVSDIALGKMLDRAKRTKGKLLPYLRNANVRWGQFDLSNLLEMYFEKDELERYAIESGDLLICEGGEPGRAAVWTDGSQSIIKYQKALLRVRMRGGLDPRWVMYSLRKDATSGNLESYFTGSTIKHFPQQAAQNYRFLLPPLNEQRRIVVKLERLVSRVDAVQERLATIPRIIKRFRQSVLAAACSGRLTADWREENPNIEPASEVLLKLIDSHKKVGGHKQGNAAAPTEDVHDLQKDELPDGWEVVELRDLCEPSKPITYGILKPGPDIPEGVPYIRVADFPNDTINLDKIKHTTKEIDSQYARSRLSAGDVLLSIRGTVGRVCIVPKELQGANITQDSARLSIQKPVSAEYVALALRVMPTQLRMQKAIKGMAIRGINIGDVRVLQIPLPPVPEQQEIVRRVEALLKTADALEARYGKAKAHVDKLTQSLLARAFRGELVTTEAELARREGRDYEPTFILLERVRQEGAQQQQQSANSKTRRKPRSKRDSATNKMFA